VAATRETRASPHNPTRPNLIFVGIEGPTRSNPCSDAAQATVFISRRER